MPASPNPYEIALDRNAANFTALTPLSFLAWAAHTYPDHPAVVHGSRRFSWAETDRRCRWLASALAAHGIGRGDTVAVMLANTPEMVEVHFGVPMVQAVLNTLNTRLDAAAIAFMLEHGEARVLITDREFSPVVGRALATLSHPPRVIDVDDPEFSGPGERLGEQDYESLLAAADPEFRPPPPSDEWQAIALNYTSGTTGNPKGVVYHHRGAHLNALANILAWGMPRHAVYLWTLPMFHCNGWCFPWTVAALAGTHVCLRRVEPASIFELIRAHRVTHYCGAPIVHALLASAPPGPEHRFTHPVEALAGGAPPPAVLIESLERMGIRLTHSYGLTETYGPAAVCAPQPGWAAEDSHHRAEHQGRQGVRYPLMEAMEVRSPATLEAVPWDGATLGEILFRGNSVMRGYLKNPRATEEALQGGWLHTGDLAVVDPDGYVRIRDRSKDIIISGGENIASLEIEEALYRHPAVLACAVVARPDPHWGETPCAFVEPRPESVVTAEELIEHCRVHLAHYKAPRHVVFGSIPRTATGKVQKYVLRERARALAEEREGGQKEG